MHWVRVFDEFARSARVCSLMGRKSKAKFIFDYVDNSEKGIGRSGKMLHYKGSVFHRGEHYCCQVLDALMATTMIMLLFRNQREGKETLQISNLHVTFR